MGVDDLAARRTGVRECEIDGGNRGKHERDEA